MRSIHLRDDQDRAQPGRRLTHQQPLGGKMTVARLLSIVAVVGAAGAACSYSDTTATVPARAYPTAGERACADYGFRVGTDPYSRCVSREAEARTLERVPITYSTINLTIDAQIACSSFGLASGSTTHDHCVKHEIDARRYREAVVTTPVPPAHGTTRYVTTTSPAPPTVHVPVIQAPPADLQEIISPQATSP
jgi:hypothetical protein